MNRTMRLRFLALSVRLGNVLVTQFEQELKGFFGHQLRQLGGVQKVVDGRQELFQVSV